MEVRSVVCLSELELKFYSLGLGVGLLLIVVVVFIIIFIVIVVVCMCVCTYSTVLLSLLTSLLLYHYCTSNCTAVLVRTINDEQSA